MMTTKYSSKRSSVGSLLSNRNKAEGARVAALSDPPPAVTPAEPAREPEAQAAPAGKRGEGGPIRLFGTLEMRSKIGKMPKWTSILEKERKNPETAAGPRQFPGQGAWKDIKAKLSGMSPLAAGEGRERVDRQMALPHRYGCMGRHGLLGDARGVLSKVGRLRGFRHCQVFRVARPWASPLPRWRIVVLKDTLRNLRTMPSPPSTWTGTHGYSTI